MSEEKKRNYYGFVLPSKVYIGGKSANIQIPNKKIMDLVGALLKAYVADKSADLTIFLERKDKRMTITSIA